MRPRRRVRRRTDVRRAALAAALLAGLLTIPTASAAGLDPANPSAAGFPDPFPSPEVGPQCVPASLPDTVVPGGLPATAPCTRLVFGTFNATSSTNYAGVSTRGIQGAPRLGQWVRIPVIDAVAAVPLHIVAQSSFPGERPGTTQVFYAYPRVYFLNADRTKVGEVPPFTVRSLAFGVVPIEVTIHLSQPVGSGGKVEPIRASQTSALIPGGSGDQLQRDARATGRVEIRLSDLRADGVPIAIGDSCRTTTPAVANLVGRGYGRTDQTPGVEVPPGRYNAQAGGTLSGTLDIPAFTGCTDGAEDYSPLLTNAVSGAGNPLTFTQSNATTACFPQDVPGRCQARLPGLELPSTPPQQIDAP